MNRLERQFLDKANSNNAGMLMLLKSKSYALSILLDNLIMFLSFSIEEDKLIFYHYATGEKLYIYAKDIEQVKPFPIQLKQIVRDEKGYEFLVDSIKFTPMKKTIGRVVQTYPESKRKRKFVLRDYSSNLNKAVDIDEVLKKYEIL